MIDADIQLIDWSPEYLEMKRKENLELSQDDVGFVVSFGRNPLPFFDIVIYVVNLLDKSYLEAKTPLRFDVLFNDKLNLYEATGPIDVYVVAETTLGIKTELADELAMCWREYAKANPSSLTNDAQKLRQSLLDHFDEVQLA